MSRRQQSLLTHIPECVAQHYYRHGLFCASQPLPVLLFAIGGIIWTCFPLLTMQFYSGNAKVFTDDIMDTAQSSERPRWLEKQPIAYIQQVIMKAAVHPYSENLLLSDAFRGPLASSFKLHLSDILGFYDKETGLDMDHECLRTDGLSPRYRSSLAHILPDYGCLILSPANIWRKDPVLFQEDGHVVNTVFNFQSSREGHSSLADIMFGLRQRDTGLTKYPVRNRQRIITYSVTLVLRQHKPQFINHLRHHLSQLYPLHPGNSSGRLVHIHFPEQINGTEYIPYTALLIGLFFYTFYSCRKIDLIQSKVGIALTAVITILGSLFMSLGLTGQSLGGTGYVYLVPYANAFIGLENILVITRSIVSTPEHLDVKIRVAQGLSKEGWNITKNLFSQITLLTLGFFLGILDNSVQEFCIFAVMGLLCDFYLQHFFFVTVFSMDISRTGLVDVLRMPRNLSRKPRPSSQTFSQSPSQQQQQANIFQQPISGPGGRYEVDGTSSCPSLVAPSLTAPPRKVPKRVQVVNFWAQRRVVSRIFLITMVVWILIFVYKAGIVDYIIKGAGYISREGSPTLDISQLKSTTPRLERAREMRTGAENISSILSALEAKESHDSSSSTGRRGESLSRLVHKTTEYWRRLPYSHWPMLFGLYNISVFGSHLSLLPPITLSMVVSPEAVIQLRSPNELKAGPQQPVWTLENIKSSLDLGDDEDLDDLSDDGPELSPFVPTSPGELMLAFALSIPSILFLVYLCVVCYRFMCTKNYAEWRTGRLDASEDRYTQIVQEGVPIPLDGHQQEIESLLSDGHLVISHCLGGKICVWDSLTGECIIKISRKAEPVNGDESAEEIDLSEEENHEGSTWKFSSRTLPSFSPGFPVSFTFRRRGHGTPSNTFTKFKNRFQSKNPGKEKSRSSSNKEQTSQQSKESAWCLDFSEGLIVVGCSTGKIEVWNASTGELLCSYQDGRKVPVNVVRLLNGRLVAVRLDGHIDFLDIASVGFSSGFINARTRTFSSNSLDMESISSIGDSVTISWRHTVKAHLQSITCVAIQGSRLITGSEDHTLRVFRVEDGVGVYTLHGHCGPITAVFIDRFNHSAAGSASQDGILCMWDLLTGACVYSIQAHDGAVLSLEYSPSYVVSYGQDGKLCVWERFHGHLINTINTTLLGEHSSDDLVMLTHNLIVTGRTGSLLVWDVRLPDPVRIVRLGKGESGEPVRLIRQIGDTIVCSTGNSLRLIRFPMLVDKQD